MTNRIKTQDMALAEEKRSERSFQESEASLLSILGSTADGILAVDNHGKVIRRNSRFVDMWRIPKSVLDSGDDGVLLNFVLDQLSQPDAFMKEVQRLYSSDEAACDTLMFKDGRYFERRSAPLIIEGEIGGRVWSFSDITERKQAEAALRESEALFFTTFQASPIPFSITDRTSEKWVAVNEAFLHVTGYTREEIIGHTYREINLWKHPEKREEMRKTLISEGRVRGLEVDINKKSGDTGTMLVSVEQVNLAGKPYLLIIGDEITERKRAEAEREKLEAQLRQAQKMESVGRLAGGVAHDFNNMLGVIIGYTEMALDQINPTHPLYASLVEIRKAAQQSADLTRQLLAFARKQTIVPKVLNLNDAVAEMLKLLPRLIGEDISLTWLPGRDLKPVKIDPSQIDQILANLCVNARDAIGGVGNITLETRNVSLDANFCSAHAGSVSGEYVMLTVKDDGCGMSPETLAQIFEPFFTTKGLGKGTGLGLATVYGIVKQNRGFISANSEVGKGSTFSIYLPQAAGETIKATVASMAKEPQGRGETILLVEDEKSLRAICCRFLEAFGYKVLLADTPGEARKLFTQHQGDIHMLLTDVVMPGMSGWDLAQTLLSLNPRLKCLFMSGYTADVIAGRGVFDESIQFILKPFSREVLARKVREVLDGPN